MSDRVEASRLAITAAGARTKEHQTYLIPMLGSKSGEEQTLLNCFRYLEEETGKLAKAQRGEIMQGQKVLVEADRALQDVSKDLNDKTRSSVWTAR